jgi:hypothetical protein
MSSNRGYASFHALVIMVFATIAGAYLLRSASKDAGTAGSFYQMRSAAVSADAGMIASLSQLVTDTTKARALLEDYTADNRKRWLLSGGGATSSPNTVAFTGTDQKYSARIVDFDPASGLIKIESNGTGTGSSSGKVTGVFLLEGLDVPHVAPQSTHALFVAGDARVSNAALVVDGPAYFGGGLTLNAGGSDFRGTFKTAAYGGGPLDLEGTASFRDAAYFETPVIFGSGASVFYKGAGFDDDVALTASPRLSGAGLTVFANGQLTGAGQIDLASNAFAYSGITANVARVRNASSIANANDMLGIPASLGFNPGLEQEIAVDFSAIPAAKVYNLARLDAALFSYNGRHIGATMTSEDLIDAFHGIDPADRIGYHNLFAAVHIDRDITLIGGDADNATNYTYHGVDFDDDDNYKWFVFHVTAKFNVNGNLWRTVQPGYGADATHYGNVMFQVDNGGSLVDFGGNSVFHGYVNVTGTGSATYKWGPGGSLIGAVHHVSPASGFGVTGPNPMRVTLDQSVINEYDLIPGLLVHPAPVPNPGPAPRITDAKIRPKLLGMYY